MKVVSVALGSDKRLGPHRIEVETEPWWWARLWGAKPERAVYVGSIVWRNEATGARAYLELETWLEEQAQRAIFKAGQ